MRFISRGALAASVAALALSVVGAASASAALPEFVPHAGGKFPATFEGKIETPGEEGKLGEIRFSAGGITLMRCKGGAKLKGEITGAKTASLTIDVEGCEDPGEEQCSSSGAAKGIVVLSGSASPVYLEKATKNVGVLLPVGTIDIECAGGLQYTLSGSLLSPITPVNTETTKFELRYAENKAGTEEEYTSYENEKGEKISARFVFNDGAGNSGAILYVPKRKKIQLTTSEAFTISA